MEKKQYPIAAIQVNILFNQPVFLDEKYILLSPETPMSQALKTRLFEWKFMQIFSEGAPGQVLPSAGLTAMKVPSADLGTKSVNSSVTSNIQDKNNTDEAFGFFQEKLKWVESLFERFKQKNELSFDEISEQIKSISFFVKDHKQYILRLSLLKNTNKNFLASHSLRVTFLALTIGDQFKLPPFKMIELGTATLLHEIGMLKLPEQIYLSPNPLGPEEKKAIIAHTILGYKILKGFSFPEPISTAVLEHHERIDGSGYPQKLSGDKISLYAKILGVACSYEALISNRPFRPAREEHASMLNLIKEMGKQYDENVLKALVINLSLYPLGSYVLLSNNAKGIVVVSNPTNPKCPSVKILINELGAIMKDPIVVITGDETNIKIIRPLTPAEISALAPAEE